MSAIVILGSAGFIGAALRGVLPHAINIDRKNIDEVLKQGLLETEVTVINCLSKVDELEENVHTANYSIPLQISQRIDVSKWVQLSSYYSEYRSIHGVDFNSYSKSKDLFSKYLEQNESFVTIDLVLPHIYWPTENRKRFVSACYFAARNKISLKVADLNQKVPLLSREKLLQTILDAVNSENQSNYNRKKVSAETMALITELGKVLFEITGWAPRFYSDPYQDSRFFSVLDWPTDSVKESERIDSLRKTLLLYSKMNAIS